MRNLHLLLLLLLLLLSRAVQCDACWPISGTGLGSNPSWGAKLGQANQGMYVIGLLSWAVTVLVIRLRYLASSCKCSACIVAQLSYGTHENCHQEYKFGTSVSWVSNRRSGIALAVRHRQ